ncbi:MAG TPA: TonB-dependent receptor [Myxococcales bacterium]|nr:TonB-dependent receptor [Myxococcales bacterium]
MPLKRLAQMSVLCSAFFALAATAQTTTPPADPAANTTAATATPPPASPVASDAPPAETAIGGTRKEAQEELIVTGSRIRRKDLTTPAPVTVVTREQFEASGKSTIGDFLQTLPEQGNAPNFQLNTGGVNYNADGTTRINLRSLGIQRTLVLVNGRRVVPGGLGASAAVDLNTIPTEAIERVEVLKDGASAIYGSDAIAGVVNIITRRTYNGTDVGAEYGASGHADAQTFDAHVTTGRSDENTSALFSVRFFQQKASFLGDRDWAAVPLDYDYTGGGQVASGSSRTPQGTLQLANNNCNGNALCIALTSTPGWTPNTRFIRDPTSTTCGTDASGQKSCWRLFGTKAPANNNTGNDFYNFAASNYLTIPSTTIQAFSSGDVKFSNVRGYYEVSYVQRNSTQNAAPMPLNPSDFNNNFVSKDSIYNPFGEDLTTLMGRRLVEFGDRTYSEELGTFRVVTGLNGTLPKEVGPLQGWFWDASMSYGKTSGTFTTGGSFRNSLVQNAVGPSTINPATGQPVCVSKVPAAGATFDPTTIIAGCTPLNLVGGPGSIPQSQQDGLGFSGTSRSFDALYSVDLNAGGELFQLASDRAVSLAVGYEFRRQAGAQDADPIVASGDSADFNFKSTNGYYTANEAYGELSIPIMSNMPGVEQLEASAALRYVNYSTFGGNTSYKLGARYSPIRDVTLRGTYSTAFRAPNISELYLGATQNDPSATDPCGNYSNITNAATKAKVIAQCQKFGVTGANGSGDNGLQELTSNGGNPNLKAETARTFSMGVVIEPHMVRGLSVTVDYFNIKIDDAIGTIGTANILNGCFVGGNDSYCALVTRGTNGFIQVVNDVNQNIGGKRTGGVDFAVRYALPTPAGRFAFGFDGSYLSFYDNTLNLATGTQVVHGVGYYDLGALPSFKATAGLDWGLYGFTAGIFGRYVGSFKECANQGDPTTAVGGLCNQSDGTINPLSRDVGSYVTFDLHAGYALNTSVGKTSFFVGMSNVLDKNPPFIYSANLASSDPGTYDYLGRYFYGRISQRF